MEEKIGSLATSETEIREALLTQQQLLQKLYAELDKEREASASAASEVMAMILRLQGEKAAMSMEAIQYWRMAEEKMGHADESITILEDVIYQKEMQIWSLECQIQAYRYKLLSLGLTEDDYPKGTVPQESGAGPRDGAENCFMRRLKSMPAMTLKDLYRTRSAMEGEVRGVVDECGPEARGLVRDKSMEVLENLGCKDLKPYWEQIRDLDERVKEISKVRFRSSSDLGKTEKEASSCHPCSSDLGKTEKEASSCHPCSSNLGKTEKEASSCHPCSSVLDIFEVPENGEKGRASWPSYVGSKGQVRLLVEKRNRLGKPDSALNEEISKSSTFKSEGECVKHTVANARCDDNQKNLVKVERRASIVCLKTDVAECRSHLQQLKERVERLEDDRSITRDEIKEAKEEDRNMLKEIMEQLNSIQSGMQSLRPKKPSSQDNVCLPLKEAMLHFWL